jgi:hypothetical protein
MLSRENIRILNLTSLLLMFILSFGLLMFCNSLPTSSNKKEKSTTGEILISKPEAAISSGIKVDISQKNWIPNEGNFRLISFARNQYFENSTVDHRIALLQYNWEKRVKIYSSFHRCQLYRPEKDEIPLLS